MSTALVPDRWLRLPLKRVAICMDHLRVPIPAWERAERPGDVPYWGANSIQGYVDEALVTGPTVLLGEDGAPFFDRDKQVAFFVYEPIWPNNHVHVLKTLSHASPRWLAYVLNSVDYTQWISGSTRDKLTQQAMMSIELLVPPLAEQQAIADFLERETAQIDATINAQERLVTLLEERRTAVISTCVTRGIFGSATRHSGVEWIGETPTHWEIQRLKNSISSAVNGTWGGEPSSHDEGVPCVRVADFDRPRLRVGDEVPTMRMLEPDEFTAKELRLGDLLIEKSGGTNKNPVGFVVLYDSNTPAVCSNFIARIRLRRDMDPRYWTYAHAASYAVRLTQRSLKQSTGIQNLDQRSYFNEPFPYPPAVEQRQIADFLDATTSRIDAMIAKARELVDLMRERRAALISAAVTGRIDLETGTERVQRELEEARA